MLNLQNIYSHDIMPLKQKWQTFINSQNKIHKSYNIWKSNRKINNLVNKCMDIQETFFEYGGFTTTGFEISIEYCQNQYFSVSLSDTRNNNYHVRGYESTFNPYSLLTHIPIAFSKNVNHSNLKWIIETDGSELEFVTPTFYVTRKGLKKNVNNIKNLIQQIFSQLENIANNKNINFTLKSMFNYFKIFDINFDFLNIHIDHQYKIFTQNEYLGDIKNFKQKPEMSPEVLNDMLKKIDENKIYYNISQIDKKTQNKLQIKFIIEAVNVAHTPLEVCEQLKIAISNNYKWIDSLKRETPLQRETPKNITFSIINDILNIINKITGEIKLKENIETLHLNNINLILSYELFRNYFYYLHTINCKIKHKFDRNKTFAANILTQVKTKVLWFKFDFISFIYTLKNMVNITNEINIIIKFLEHISDKNVYYKLFHEVSEIIEEEIFTRTHEQELSTAIDEYNQLKDTIQIKELDKHMTSRLLRSFLRSSKIREESIFNRISFIKNEITKFLNTKYILYRPLCSNKIKNKIKPNVPIEICGKCALNYLDYNSNFLGVRHDTYLDNYLVIEYRDQNPIYFPDDNSCIQDLENKLKKLA
jgi:hypothetical protein